MRLARITKRPRTGRSLLLAIVEITKLRGLAVHDHIVVGNEGHASLKGLKLI
jgi:DNA repair protein RadC